MGILSDSLGLMSQSTSSRSIHIIGELVEAGVNLAELESLRRETLRRDVELIHYKGELLQRVEYYGDNRVAIVSIPWEEIEKYSPHYNPSMLVIDDMRLAKGTDIAIAFKLYKDGKVTAKIRCNYGYGIADKLAEHFGGGGHPMASGFKITDGRSYENIKSETIDLISKGMVAACQPGGTAWPLFGYNIPLACKTGTAEFGTEDKTHGWLTLFAPADKPEISITVLVEGGGEGSDVAAPVAKKILEKYFSP